MNKKIFLIIGFCIIFFSTAFVQLKNNLPSHATKQVSFVSIKQTVAKVQRTERVQSGFTALQLLSTTHTVVTKGQKENAFVTAIDGKVADQTKREFWAFSVNGKQAEVGAGSYKIKNNDTIEWKIETY